MSRRHVLVSVLALTFCVPVATSQFVFAPGSTPAPSAFTWDVDVADLDSDGDLDVILSEPVTTAGVVVYLNDGTGSYAAPVTYDVGDWADATAVGDVDGDGDPDLVTVTKHFATSLVTLLNDGSGAFTVLPGVTAGSLPEDVALGDLDGDGDLDAALSNWNVDSISFLYGDGAGGFGGEVLIPTSGGNGFAVALPDLDADGDLDPVMVSFGDVFPGGGRLHVFYNPGNGVFGAPVTQVIQLGAWAVDTGDVDVDLMSTNRNTDTVSFFFNDGAGNLAPEVTAPVGSFPVDGHLADLDGDGDLDVVAGSNQGTDMHVLENDGAGNFSPAVVIRTTQTFYCGETGDMDGDGDVDIWFGGSGSLSYYDNLAELDPWVDLGAGLAGAGGEPLLDGSGPLTPGSTVELDLSGALAGAPATLVAGVSSLFLGFKGGTLVPSPDALVPLAVSGAGGINLSGTWPGALPSGTQLLLQYWVVDASGPVGYSASNAVRGDVP
ncbi:MAG: FG-GAP-like repeat-containing protein [Planctomycetota bacterium]|jgi:hypothetical protein